jgi:hypothetical protein
MRFEIKKLISPVNILFIKISSSSATSQPEIFFLIFYRIVGNFQLTLQEMKPNNRNWIIKKPGNETRDTA